MEPGTITIGPEHVPGARWAMHYQLERVFEVVGGLAYEFKLAERDRKQLSAELAAVLPQLGEIIAHLDRLGWNHSDEPGSVTLEVNDVLRATKRGGD